MKLNHLTTACLAALIVPLAAQAQDDLKIGYINKMGDHPWFVAEVAGAAEAAREGGAEFVSQDVQFNADLAITTLDTMIGDGVDGIAIVVPDRALGPVVAARAAEAGVPLVAVDDDIRNEAGEPVPYVGLNAFAIGERVGEELATFYEESGWSKDSVGVVSIEDRKADTCMQRNGGAEKALLENSDLTEDQIVRAAYDNTMVNSIDVMTTTLTANPQYDHWIFYACNDDGVLGAARAMENSGYPADAGIGIGIDGSRACDAFGNGRESAFKGTMWLNSANHGRDAVELLLAAIKDGTELPQATYSDPEFITMENFGDYSDQLCN
ncbi:MAG: arabinose ABC transporter substrate-binding protein [Rhodobacteraceae bacterium]|jgi:L-arabinose transport system substrate-binding protein|uniref:L-arabinose transport system substrate-binding protein n=1 Tax=Salipiger profundus TaxID=1229727 RepID=A0A1U7D8H8_9RHOB|nr:MULTISPECIES: substrate-binding domain-containing protein [Salipiger]APX24370.1 L-arabinose transport system substrate-binding protein [Salipiger profundus]MAB07327.1 arabinose ABC transporter substrate-binding protein [Paracoccaceae bacterium]GGA19465.1 sugar ABC transporter substrate-binding protein [Salipiger profundus]SFD36693.1 L-arabinose-binding protein [Salipiger profundus]